MSIIPVICHYYLQNSSKRNLSSVSSNIRKNQKVTYSKDVMSKKESIDRPIINSCSRNNTRGGFSL